MFIFEKLAEIKGKIPLSQDTEKLLAEIRPSKAKLIELQKDAAVLLGNDKDPTEAVAKKLSLIHCEEAVIHNRLIRKAEECKNSFINDAKTAFAAAEEKLIHAREAWQAAKMSWRELCLEEYAKSGKGKAEQIAKDKKFSPLPLRQADRDYREAQKFVGEAERWLCAVDVEHYSKHCGMINQYNPLPDFNKNVMFLLDELDGLLPVYAQIGSKVSGI